MNRFIIFMLLASFVFISSCSLKPTVSVTIYNSTQVTGGELTILYGDYESEYADGRLDYIDVSWPFTFTIPDATVCTNYIVYAELDDYSTGLAWDGVLTDTRFGGEIDVVLDLELHITQVDDLHEEDDTFQTASVIQVGEYQARSLMDTADVDYVSFYATSGRTYAMETERHGGSQTNLTLYDPGLNQLAYNQYGGDGGGSRIVWTAPYSGACYVKVDNTGSSTYYGLWVYRTSPDDSARGLYLKWKEWVTR